MRPNPLTPITLPDPLAERARRLRENWRSLPSAVCAFVARTRPA